MNNGKTQPILTLYVLGEVFDKVSKRIKQLEDAMTGSEKSWSEEKLELTGLKNIQKEMLEWSDEGFKYVSTDRPFSDDIAGADDKDTIISQFGDVAYPYNRQRCCVAPVPTEVVRCFGLDI